MNRSHLTAQLSLVQHSRPATVLSYYNAANPKLASPRPNKLRLLERRPGNRYASCPGRNALRNTGV
jgi:hypothetical protein